MGKYKRKSRSRSRSAHKHHRHHRNRSASQQSSSSQSSSSSSQPKYKIQQTKVLCIDNCTSVEAEQALVEASIRAGTSVPDEVYTKDENTYAKYPSIQVSSRIIEHLKNAIQIGQKNYRINFYPFRKIDINASYDWYCQQCDYKNFARRNKCYRCQSQKTSTCKLNYNTQQTSSKLNKEDNINNCSLMVRGTIVTSIEEEVLLDIFESYAPIKDIRMIRNKMTGQMKDFAFIEFFTPEEAALALKNASAPEFRIRGQKVSVMYSRNKSEDDYAKPLPYEKRQRRRDFNKKQKKNEPIENYYKKQRQMFIEQEKQRPLITLQQLKQKRQQQLKKHTPVVRQMTAQQNKRRQAQLMAKQWQKQVKMQNSIIYICALCRRKFKGEEQMKAHQKLSQLHRYNLEMDKLSL